MRNMDNSMNYKHSLLKLFLDFKIVCFQFCFHGNTDFLSYLHASLLLRSVIDRGGDDVPPTVGVGQISSVNRAGCAQGKLQRIGNKCTLIAQVYSDLVVKLWKLT